MDTKKIVSLTVISTLLFWNFSFSLALSPMPSTNSKILEKNQKNTLEEKIELKWEAKKFQEILDKYFIKKDDNLGNYRYNRYYYRDFGGYIPNAKYNRIIEKELELIIIKTYENNKKFYEKFSTNNDYNNFWQKEEKSQLNKILSKIPKVFWIDDFSAILFNENNISNRLLESSFKVNYSSYNNNNYDSFLRALSSAIKRYKSTNGYYPSLEELKKENIFLNREKQNVGENMQDVIYEVKKQKLDKSASKLFIFSLRQFEKDLKNQINNLTNDFVKNEILEDFNDIKENNLSDIERKKVFKKYYKKRYSNKIFRKFVDYLNKKFFDRETFTLKYKNKFYTLAEAKAEIKKIEKLKVNKKDYEKLIWDSKLKDIPEIYKKIPNDSIFIHIKNPKFLFSFLDDKKNNSSSGLWIIKKLRDLIASKMQLENWDELKQNLTHEFIIVLSDLDLVSPNFLIILDKKDKWILVPWEKAMAAKSVWDKIYISLSKKLLEEYSNLDEKDSVYNSSDFRYVWFKKQGLKKDIFFFAWDNFFEKITSLEYFLNMKRKINDYMNLWELQNYAFALQKINWEKTEDFSELKKLLKFKENKLEKYEIKNSIVTDKNIWKIGDIKNLTEINYDLEKISRSELASYKENILDYREMWQASLDPLWVIFSEEKNGYKIDFFMTPIPSLKDFELDFLTEIFTNFWKKDFEIIKNPKMRIWMLWWVFGFDSVKLQKFLDEQMQVFIKNKENSDFKDDKKNRKLRIFLGDYNRMNAEFFWWSRSEITKESILDYLDWEFLLSFGWIDTSIFDSWNAEKLDVILAVKFKNKIKAKEFVSILRKKFGKEFSRYSRHSIEGKAKELLAKPLGEEYNWMTIYSVPAPYIGNIYYSIIDSFAYISISKKSLQNSIDFYKNPDSIKQKFIKNYLSWDKIFYSFFDSENLEKAINKMFSKENLIDLFVAVKREWFFWNMWNINPLILAVNKYYKDYEYSILTWKKLKEIKWKVWFFSFYSSKWEIFLSIAKDELKINNVDIKSEIKNIFEKIDKKYFTKKWWNILEITNNPKILEELFSLNTFNSVLDKDFRDEIMPNNLAFSFGIWDNEIQLKMASFSEIKKETWVVEKTKKIFSDFWKGVEKTNNILYIIIWFLSLVILWAIWFVFFRRK